MALGNPLGSALGAIGGIPTYIPTAVAGGTPDAITASFNPPLELWRNPVVAIGALYSNATTTPTLSTDGTQARTIVKGGSGTLIPYDIPGPNARMLFQYDSVNSKWQLLNPATNGLGGTARGYALGGTYDNINSQAVTSRYTFITDAASALGATLGTAVWYQRGVNSGTVGYSLGGKLHNAGSSTTAIQGMTFSTELTYTSGAVLSNAQIYCTDVQTGLVGYIMSGSINDLASFTTMIQKFTFAGEVQGAVSATVGTTEGYGGGVNSATNGYAMGGINNAMNAGQVNVQRLAFSNETCAASGNNLTQTLSGSAATNSSTNGYTLGAGGGDATPNTSAYSLTFSTEGVVAVTNILSTGRSTTTPMQSLVLGLTYGGGGYGTIISGIAFATQSTFTSAAVVPSAITASAGCQNGGIY